MMMRSALAPSRMRLSIVAAIAALTWSAMAQERDRATTADRYKWNLGDLYASEEAWRTAKDRFVRELPQLAVFRGQLAASAATLASALDEMYALDKDLARLSVYANSLADQDTRDSHHQGLKQDIVQLAASFAAQKSFIEPEILRFPPGTAEKFLSAEPQLKVYAFYLKDIVRRAAHTLTDAEEKLLADAGPLTEAPGETYGIMSNADLPYPAVTLSDGRVVKVDQAGYNRLRALGNRSDREKVMAAFFTTLGSFSRTFGTTMNGEVRKLAFLSTVRKYPSALAFSLDGPNIPTTAYTRLVDAVNRNLPVFHRYLGLRKRMLGVSQLHYYDLYAPLVASVALQYTPEEAQKHVVAAVAPLGPEYQAIVRRAFDDRWIDLFPNTGKRSGAYSEGAAYDVHPYMLLNFDGQYASVSTLAHELGHTMQSYLSNKTQPYPLASYPTFVAEVASTFNEKLLIEYMLANTNDQDRQLSLLGNYLENIKATVFRQTQFAEFELRMHEMAQQGQPITGDSLARLYLAITKRYYGHDEGVSVVDDYVAHEWSFIPHFYRDFYVYQYATSFTASAALAEKVRSGDPGAKQRYLAFLSSGGSKYPIELLKDAGVDITSDEPLMLTMKAMTRVMDEMDALLAKRAR
jgi:oligoendopeptidase F